jgi:hypothetical protein
MREVANEETIIHVSKMHGSQKFGPILTSKSIAALLERGRMEAF